MSPSLEQLAAQVAELSAQVGAAAQTGFSTAPVVDSYAIRPAGAAVIPAESITTEKLAKEAVTTAKIANEAVATAQIAKFAITSGLIGANAVTAEKIGAEEVTTGKLFKEAVTEAKIGATAVSETKLSAEAVSAAKIKKETITSEQIKEETILARNLGSESVTTGKLAKEAVTLPKALLATIPVAGAENTATLGAAGIKRSINVAIKGNGAAKEFTLAHNFATSFVYISKVLTATFEQPEAAIAFKAERINNNEIKLILKEAPGAGVVLNAIIEA